MKKKANLKKIFLITGVSALGCATIIATVFAICYANEIKKEHRGYFDMKKSVTVIVNNDSSLEPADIGVWRGPTFEESVDLNYKITVIGMRNDGGDDDFWFELWREGTAWGNGKHFVADISADNFALGKTYKIDCTGYCVNLRNGRFISYSPFAINFTFVQAPAI